MASLHRITTETAPADATQSHLERAGTRVGDVSPPHVSLTDHPYDTTQARRIERVQLQARVLALEKALLERSRREQAIVDQYERVLDERAQCQRRDSSNDRAESDSGSDSESDGASEPRPEPVAECRCDPDFESTTVDPITQVRRLLASVRR